MMKLLIAAAIVTAGVTAADAATWQVMTQDDIFSGKQTAQLVATIDWQDGLDFSCDSDGTLSAALVFRGEWKDIMAGQVGTLLLKVDDKPVQRFDAVLYQHNTKMIGFGTADDGVRNAIEEIGEAKHQVLVGMEITSVGWKKSATAPADGSTDAAKKFLATCARPPAPTAGN